MNQHQSGSTALFLKKGRKMSNYNDNENVNGVFSFMGLLFIVFLVLKLTGAIAWSWWWVTAPLWGPFAITLIILFIMIVIFGK